MLLAFGGCGSDDKPAPMDMRATVVALPGAMRQIDFDDIVYSARLDRVLVPAGRSGLYLVEPRTGDAQRVGPAGTADSADEGRGLLFALDRGERALRVLEPAGGRVIASLNTANAPDYVRYIRSTGEVWVTEPTASPPGIEVFTVPAGAPRPARAAFIPLERGAEGLEWSSATGAAYTHTGDDVVALDPVSRSVAATWPTACGGTHGFPRVDARDRLLLASCADGEVVLLDLDSGRRIDRYAAGDGEALPGYAGRSGHFYARTDPGTRLVTLKASRGGLRVVRHVEVPAVGHCLTADGVGHYWTCDAENGRLLRFDDR